MLLVQTVVSCRLVNCSSQGSVAATVAGGFVGVAGAGKLGRDQSVDCSELAGPYRAACSVVMNYVVCWSVRLTNRLFEVVSSSCWDCFLRWAALASSRQVMHSAQLLGQWQVRKMKAT